MDTNDTELYGLVRIFLNPVWLTLLFLGKLAIKEIKKIQGKLTEPFWDTTYGFLNDTLTTHEML